MSDDKLKEIAERIANGTHTLLECYGPPNEHGCPLYRDTLAALQQARDLGRRETLAEPASIPGTDAAVKLATALGYDVAKFPMVTQIMRQHIDYAVERGREEERKALAPVVGALRDLLRDVDARLGLDAGFKGMGHNILTESAGRLRVDAEYARKQLAALDARSSQVAHKQGPPTGTVLLTYCEGCGEEWPCNSDPERKGCDEPREASQGSEKP